MPENNNQNWVGLSYSVPGMEIRFPFRMGVIANLAGHGQLESPDKREFVRIDKASFDAVLRLQNVSLQLVVDECLTGDDDTQLSVKLSFHEFSDFHPDNLVKQVPILSELLSHRANANSELGRDIDARLSRQLAAIMHHPDFQALEGTWRGLERLVSRTQTGQDVEIVVLSASREEFQSIVDNSSKGSLYEKLTGWRGPAAGSSPFGALVVDYSWSHHPDDIQTLRNLAAVCEQAKTCVLSAASPRLLGLATWGELESVDARTIGSRYEDPTYTAWQSFRRSEPAKFITFTSPRVLARHPFGSQSGTATSFDFEELSLFAGDAAAATANLCWSNAAFVLAENVLAWYSRTGWFSRCVGHLDGGKVDGLPRSSGDGGSRSTEAVLGFDQDYGVGQLGMANLCSIQHTDTAVFMACPTLHLPKEFLNESANNAVLSANQLPCVLAISRVAHYALAILHSQIGAYQSAAQLTELLQNWLMSYVLADDSPSDEFRGRYFFRNADVELRECPGHPGGYLLHLSLDIWLDGMRRFPVPVILALRIDDYILGSGNPRKMATDDSEIPIPANEPDENGFYRSEIKFMPMGGHEPLTKDITLVSELPLVDPKSIDGGPEESQHRIDFAELKAKRSRISDLRQQLAELEAEFDRLLAKMEGNE